MDTSKPSKMEYNISDTSSDGDIWAGVFNSPEINYDSETDNFIQNYREMGQVDMDSAALKVTATDDLAVTDTLKSMVCHQFGGGESDEPQPGPSRLGKRKTTFDHREIPTKQSRIAIQRCNDRSTWMLHTADDNREVNEDLNNESSDPDPIERHFELKEVKRTFGKKFNLESHDHQVRFREMDTLKPEEFPLKVHQILDRIFKHVLDEPAANSKVRVYMDADGLNNPYNGPFINAEEFDANRVITSMGKILNSNEKILLEGGEIRINVIRVHMPTPGSARGTRREHMNNRSVMDIPTWKRKKGSLVTIVNNDNICMARALVVGIAAVQKNKTPTPENLKNYTYIRDSRRPLQKKEAEDLHAAADVPLLPCGMDEAQKFQAHLSDYQILIYAAHLGMKRIFTGPHKPDRLALFLNDNHYDAIISLTGFLGCSYICNKCLAGTNDLKKHACSISCYSCKSTECAHTEMEAKLHCEQCNRFFYDDNCMQMHKANGTCAKKVRCKHCNRSGHSASDKRCNKRLCHVCKKWVEYSHLCYMQKEDHRVDKQDPKKKEQRKPPPLRYYYDFECTQETGVHLPNLVICKGEEDDVPIQFYGERSRDQFCEWIFDENCGLPRDGREKVFIAHYAKAYDSFFILEYLHSKKMFINPIKTGLKILSLDVPKFNCKFLDSHSFLPMPLAKFPATFGLNELKKGYFPHYFNTVANKKYNGPLPEESFYGSNTMTVANRSKFLKWHAEERERYAKNPHMTFNLKDELIAYCNSDVQILKESCMSFRKEFIETTGVDPFSAITIASVCHKVFRTHILKPHTIGIVPQDGYVGRKKQQSRKALQWMGWMAHENNISIVNASSLNGEAQVGTKYVDGLCTSNKTIFEFHGCYYHGCQRCFNPRENNCRLGCKMGDLHAGTVSKEKYLARVAPDHKLVVIWECEYDKMVKSDPEMADFVRQMDIPEPLNPRHAFYGGRTHASRLYAKVGEREAIRYYDFVSLYPTINKFGKMPVGHPDVVYPDTYEQGEYFGLIMATVLPPRRLFHPVLPYRARGKLLFPLCRTCAEDNNQEPCVHDDHARELTATWCTPEVDVALAEGYKITSIQCIWHYKEHAEYGVTLDKYPHGLFGEYVDMFLKIKQQASGWPSWVKTEADKDKFIEDYFRSEKVKLDKTKVAVNPGKRALAKLCLNSFWGRFGMREDLPQTEYVKEYDRFVELMTSPKYILGDINIVNEDMLLATYRVKKDFISGSSHTNVVIAAFTTTLARLKLYELLKILGQQALYMDTDSVIFISNVNDDPLSSYLGENLGKMTDEITAEHGAGAYITEYVSGGPKNYGYQVSNGATTFKVKGITQNFENSGKVNFQVMLDLIHGFVGEGENTRIVLDDKKIKRNMLKASLTNTNSTRTYKIVYDKAVVGQNYVAYPFGF